MTERGDELDHSLLGRVKDEKKKGRREMREGREGRRETLPGCTSPTRLHTSVCVHAWVFVSVSERDGDMEGGCYSPIFQTRFPGEGYE